MDQPRQTLSYVKSLLDARGLRPKDKLGQNFLIDLNLLDLIVRSAELERRDVALEIGAGTGGLTTRLSEHAGAVVSVELDPSIFELAQETVEGQLNVRLLNLDALKNKNELNTELLAAIGEQQERFNCDRIKLVANLPYAVATPVFANLLIGNLAIDQMVVTVQWEIAERLMAEPGTSDFGALTVLVQSLADVSLIRKLPPAVFWPRPLVESAIVQITPNPEKRRCVVDAVGDISAFRVFLRDLYTHRRKNLRGALVGWPSGRRDKTEVDRLLTELDIPAQVRAEDLDIETHLRLCRAFTGR